MRTTQSVRLVDVFALGPFMVWAGARRGRMPSWMRGGLVLFGLGTVLYNGVNYLRELER